MLQAEVAKDEDYNDIEKPQNMCKYFVHVVMQQVNVSSDLC